VVFGHRTFTDLLFPIGLWTFMTTNFRGIIGETGLFTLIRSSRIPKPIEIYRNADGRVNRLNELATSY